MAARQTPQQGFLDQIVGSHRVAEQGAGVTPQPGNLLGDQPLRIGYAVTSGLLLHSCHAVPSSLLRRPYPLRAFTRTNKHNALIFPFSREG
jgi:hypothetical protein